MDEPEADDPSSEDMEPDFTKSIIMEADDPESEDLENGA